MIQANELRIGNIVADDTGRIGNVVEFTEKSIRIKMQFSNVKIDSGRGFVGLDVEPVPLTYDVIKKLGFIEISNENYGYPQLKLNGYSKLNTNSSGDATYLFFDGYRIPCNSVHQLQNLYFSLTGKELNVEILNVQPIEKPLCGVGEKNRN